MVKFCGIPEPAFGGEGACAMTGKKKNSQNDHNDSTKLTHGENS